MTSSPNKSYENGRSLVMKEHRSNNILYYGLLLFFLFEYIRPDNYIPLLRVLKVGTILPLMLFIFTFFSNKSIINQEVCRASNSKWLAFFLTLLVVSILTAEVTLYSYTKFKGVVGYILIYFIIAKEINTINRMKGLFATLGFLHIIVIILSPDIILRPETRPYLATGVFLGDGNDFALSVSIALPFCFFLLLDENSKLKKMIFLLVSILLLLSIIGTSSRGGSLALFAVIFYLWSKSQKKSSGLILLLLLSFIVVLFAPEGYFDRIATIRDYENEGSAQGRIMAWKSATRMALAHPLLGVGSGHFAVKLGTDFRPPEYGLVGGAWITAHSCYFLILGELGVPGIIFFLSIIISNLCSNEKKIKELARRNTYQAIETRKLLICLNGGLIGFAVGGAFLSAVYYPHLYVIAGLFTSAHFICNRIIDKYKTSTCTNDFQSMSA